MAQFPLQTSANGRSNSNGKISNGSHKSSEIFTKSVAPVAVSLLWMMVSSVLIILNKHILSDKKFHFPMALTALGMSFSSVASFLCCRVFNIVPVTQPVSVKFYVTAIMPVGLLMAGTLFCGNLVYLYLNVAFIQMLKAFTPIITLLCMVPAGLETLTAKLMASVAVIATGTIIASYGEIKFNILGVVIMFTSELLESIRLVMTQYLMTGLHFHPIESLMYMAPSCALWLLLGSVITELPTMIREGALTRMAQEPWLYMVAAGMGFTVNATVFGVIKLTSSLTLKILGTVKNAAVVIYAALFLGEAVTGLQSAGYSIGLAGFLWYTIVQQQRKSAASSDQGRSPANSSFHQSIPKAHPSHDTMRHKLQLLPASPREKADVV